MPRLQPASMYHLAAAAVNEEGEGPKALLAVTTAADGAFSESVLLCSGWWLMWSFLWCGGSVGDCVVLCAFGSEELKTAITVPTRCGRLERRGGGAKGIQAVTIAAEQ